MSNEAETPAGRREPGSWIELVLPSWLSAMRGISDAIARDAGIGASDLICWQEVVADGPLPAGELARRLRLTTGAITHMVDRLTKAGVVRRVLDAGDRRKVLIEAVPEERDRIFEHYVRLGEQVRSTLTAFSLEEQEVIARFFRASLSDTRALLEEMS